VLPQSSESIPLLFIITSEDFERLKEEPSSKLTCPLIVKVYSSSKNTSVPSSIVKVEFTVISPETIYGESLVY